MWVRIRVASNFRKIRKTDGILKSLAKQKVTVFLKELRSLYY